MASGLSILTVSSSMWAPFVRFPRLRAFFLRPRQHQPLDPDGLVGNYGRRKRARNPSPTTDAFFEKCDAVSASSSAEVCGPLAISRPLGLAAANAASWCSGVSPTALA